MEMAQGATVITTRKGTLSIPKEATRTEDSRDNDNVLNSIRKK